jgi:predicted nucleotidyltransferase
VSSNDPIAEFRALADRAVAAFSAHPEVRGVVLIGSVSRGDAVSHSDVDLVVLMREHASRSTLRTWLPEDLRGDRRLSLLPQTSEGWLDEAARGSLFVHHVAREGTVLMDLDGTLAESFAVVKRVGIDIDAEVRLRSARLRLFGDLRRFNGRHLFALSQLYSIGKGLAIARCAEYGEVTFVKQEAFSRLAEHRPDWSEHLDRIAALRPFYDLTHERDVHDDDLPFPPVGAEDHLSLVIEDIQALARG